MSSLQNNQLGEFLAILRTNNNNLSQEQTSLLAGCDKSFIWRVENGKITLPAKGAVRKRLMDLAEILCHSAMDQTKFLDLAQLDRSTLTAWETIQLGKFSAGNITESDLESLLRKLEIHINQLSDREREFGVTGVPPSFKMKLQAHKNLLRELISRGALQEVSPEPHPGATIATTHSHIEGRIVVGHQYGDSFPTSLRGLYTLASPKAQSLMDQANLERFAVDDCILLSNSRDFKGWEPGDIRTSVLGHPVPLPPDLEELQKAKLPSIAKDYYNSSHYRLVSYTPSFSDSGALEIVMAPIGFHDYYSITPYFDEPLLKAVDGSKLSIREKYGNTALMYSSLEQGRSLIPTPISLQCLVLTQDEQILLMRRSDSVAFYPGHMSASYEETMNAPGLDRKGQPSRSDDANFFSGALRGLDEELAIPEDAVSNMRVLSLCIEYLTLSFDVIMLLEVAMPASEIRQRWLLKAADRDEASKFVTLPATLDAFVEKLLSKTLWHPTARMRLIQFLFHRYGVDEVAKALQQHS